MKTDFSIPQRVLHWLMVVLLAFNLLASDAMGAFGNLYFGDQPIPGDIAFAASVHATIGIAILVLGVLRLCLRFVQGVPPSPAVEPPLLRLVAKLCHFAFYAIFIIMPLAGIGAYYFKNSTAAFAHIGWMKVLLWLLIGLHVAGVLVHQFYWKTDVLKRMTSGVSRPE